MATRSTSISRHQERTSGETLLGQGPERFEAIEEARGHQHGQGADLCHRDFRAENRRQMSRGNGASAPAITTMLFSPLVVCVISAVPDGPAVAVLEKFAYF